MSRIGKKAVPVPSGVTANVEGQTIKVKGPKGALQLVLHDDVKVAMDKGGIQVDPRSETKRARSQWGTSRTLINNLITGAKRVELAVIALAGVADDRERKREQAAHGRRDQRRSVDAGWGAQHPLDVRSPNAIGQVAGQRDPEEGKARRPI